MILVKVILEGPSYKAEFAREAAFDFRDVSIIYTPEAGTTKIVLKNGVELVSKVESVDSVFSKMRKAYLAYEKDKRS